MSDSSDEDIAALKDQIATLTASAADAKSALDDLKAQLATLQQQHGKVTDFLVQLKTWWQSSVLPSALATQPNPVVLPSMADPPQG